LKTNAQARGRVRARWLLGLAGWILAAVLGVLILPRVYHRLILRVPAVRQDHWNQVVADRQAALAAAPWKDARPLNILAGDSHIELGNWYDLFEGACAVRNCGLSGATIRDVTRLVAAVPDRHPDTLVLMCGINDLGRKTPVDQCVADYEKLLAAAGALNPRRLIVASVMPVRQTPVDLRARELNREVTAFNERLEKLCGTHRAVFLDVNPAVTNASGGLADDCTVDGLHLNGRGYLRIADLLRRRLGNEAAGQN
jgi:lysophospholipase L1-like esterase